jgi:hypothetical protein
VRLGLGVLLFSAGIWIGSLALPQNGLRAAYYPNLSRGGPPVATTVDREASASTLRTGTASGWSQFAVEWTGFIRVPEAGTYTFSILSDDGSELEIGQTVVVQNGGVHGPQERNGTIDVDAGIHPFRLRYEQAGGGLALEVRMARQGEPLQPIPAAALFPKPISPTEYQLRRASPLVVGGLFVALWIALGRQPVAHRAVSRAYAWTQLLGRSGIALAIVVLTGVVSRLFVLLGTDGILWPDSDIFLNTSDAILAGRLTEHDPFRTLLYPYFLAAFLYFGNSVVVGTLIVMAQQLIGLAAAIGFFFVARNVLGPVPALTGAVLFNLHTMELFYEVSVLTETVFVCVLSVSLLLIRRLLERPSLASAAAVGVACGALTLTRPVAQWYVLVPAFVVLIATRGPVRSRLVQVGAVAMVYAVIITPWMAINQSEFGFFGVALGRGLGLFIRAFEIDRLPQPSVTSYPDVQRALGSAYSTGRVSGNFVHADLKSWGYSTHQADDAMYGYALEAIGERPGQFAASTVKQWGIQLGGNLGGARICRSASGEYLCSGRTIGYGRPPFRNAPRERWPKVREMLVAFVRHGYVRPGVVLALALFGMLAYFARQPAPWPMALTLALTIAYYTFVAAATQWPQDRYRLPVDALLFTFAAIGVGEAIGALRRPDQL